METKAFLVCGSLEDALQVSISKLSGALGALSLELTGSFGSPLDLIFPCLEMLDDMIESVISSMSSISSSGENNSVSGFSLSAWES